MTTKCRSGTCRDRSRELDRELSEVLTAISVVSKRIADRLDAVSTGEKVNMEGGRPNGKDERVVYAHRGTSQMW